MLTTIQHQSRGNIVKVAQYLTGLAARGKASGNFDADFVAAVSTWQKKRGLVPDGVIGADSWRKIADEAPLCTTSKNRKSAEVCALQILLNAGLDVDGVFGTKTKKAVAAYQSANGLEPDGKCGSKTWAALIYGDVADSEESEFKQPVDYKQFDPKWAKKLYTSTGNKKQTMKSSACGPTAAADVVATLKDSTVDPYNLAQEYVKHGHRSASGGTAWSAFKWTAEKYGFSKFIQTSSLATLKACLKSGGYAVCSMGPGYWTKGGHFICAWKYDDKYIYCNDPASNVRKKQKQKDFLTQRKQFFCFYP